ncbi:F-actin-monooxygenase Mical [Dendroctonus ponderosae]|nr:F-actin-monooxygenase Mical [Dendroctonus ponderosae]
MLTPADRQIIDSLGITGESDSRKTCHQQTSHNRQVERARKFSFGRRQRLYGDHRPAKESNNLPPLSGSVGAEREIEMEFFDDAKNVSPKMNTRVQKWISQHDFKADEGKKGLEAETTVTRAQRKRKGEYDGIKVEQRTDVIKCESPTQSSHEDFVQLVKLLKDGPAIAQKERRAPIKPISKYRRKSMSAPPANFSVILEGEKSELPESNKRSEFSFKSIKTSNHQPSIPNNQASMPSSRHKRHADIMVPKPSSIDRKQRKRRTLEPIGPSVDYDSRITGLKPLANTNAEEDIAAKIRSLEDKWSGQAPSEKKPKDLMRAIGKIETSDWNIKQIEKKILENKIGKPSTLNADKERVPRWSKEEFRARQTKMEKKHLDRQESAEAKYADIDRNIKQLELKLKEGTNRELGQNKVASITEKLVNKTPVEPEKPAQPKPVGLPVQSGSEFCHFCWKRVYLMERVSAEGKFFHHRCFKCKYCHSQLRLGSYMFDRDGQYDYGFFCIHHFGMQGELPRPTKVTRKPSVKGPREAGRSPQKKPLSAVAGVDLLDRVRTPERIEFANLSTDNISDHEEPLSQMDEDEWTDKNFGASCNELDESDDDSSSSVSDTDSDDEDAFDDALEQPITKEGTMKWAERLKNSYRKGHHSDSDGYSSSDHSSYYENSTDDSDSDTATEGEEEIRARELRRQEVRVEPPVVQTDTGTDTEVKKSLDILPREMVPDILNDHNNRLDPQPSPAISKSPSNYSINSEVFNSAESDVDFNMNQTSALNPNVVVGKLTFAPTADCKPPVGSKYKQQSSRLAKSATAGNLGPKPKRNFVLPPKEQRRSFVQEFTPKFKLEEPLLVIKRTPSKVNLPKEIKPKVAVTAKALDTNKYFGAPMNKLQRSGTRMACPKPHPPLVKQTSLPETGNFNFDLKDSDWDNVDNYIEDLLTNQDELSKPVDISKYIQPPEEQEEDVSSSIEDLFSALEKTAEAPNIETQKECDEKIEDLLKWMEELDHQTPARKVYRSVSDAKYKNLESLLKRPQTGDSLVSKLPKTNVAFFEAILKGKPLAKDSSSDENLNETRSISRSKTEVHFNRSKHPRTSVDLEAVSKVNIKSVLKKFESLDQEEEEANSKPEKPVVKRFSLGNFPAKSPSHRELKAPIVKPKPIGKTIKKFESQPKEFKKIEYKPAPLEAQRSFEDSIKDLEKFVDDTIESIGKSSKSDGLGKSKSDWCVNVTVSSKVSPEFLKLQQKTAENQSKPATASGRGNVESNPADADFAKELQDFQVAMSVLTDEASTSEETPKPHNFFKAVQSSDSSTAEELEQPESSISSEYKKEAALPHDFTPAVLSSSFEGASEAGKVHEDALYSKVVKPNKEPSCSPAAPPRRKHSQGSAAVPLPPPRAARQKSQDLTVNNENVPQPIAPQRKRCNTASPLVRRKNPELKPLNRNGKSTSTSNLEKVIVGSFELPGPQKVSISGTKSLSSENLPKFPPKYGRKDKDKDCCIQ